MNPLALIPFPYRILALIALALSLFGYGWLKGAQHGERKLDAYKVANDKAVLAQVNKAAEASANLMQDAQTLEQVKNEKIADIQSQLDVALSKLRNRPERRPDNPANPAACAGANGSELAREDAEFLAGEASAAAVQQAERNHAIEQYNEVKAILDKMRDEAKKAAQ